MGEYWAPCNLTKRERYCPIGADKTHGNLGREMHSAILFLIAIGRWSKDDDIRFLSDASNEVLLDRASWCAIADTATWTHRTQPGISQEAWYDLAGVTITVQLEEDP